MPKKRDPELRTPGGTLKSQITASQKYNTEKMEMIGVRVPVGTRALITEYVERKATEDPTNPKYSSLIGKTYKPSVNAMILALLQEETGIDFSALRK